MNGFLIINKPEGISSNQALTILKQKTGIKKIGHTGTLDPFATGLLVVGFGEALKFISYLQEEPKVYEAVLKLGEATDTLDKTGVILAKKEYTILSIEEVKERIKELMGEKEQIPPMFSAKKKEGKKLYELAREGIEVEREPRKIHIYKLEINRVDSPFIHFSVSCSRGTYVRVLGEEIAMRLNTVGHLIQLRRIQAGSFFLKEGVKLHDSWNLEDRLLSLPKVLSHLPSESLNVDQVKDLFYGKAIETLRDYPENTIVTLMRESCFLGVGFSEGKKLRPKRLIQFQLRSL